MLPNATIAKMQKSCAKEEKWPEVMGVLSDPVRFRILKLLLDHKEACVTDIAKVFKMSVPAASHQLKALERGGVLKIERQGQMKCYAVNREDSDIQSLLKFLFPKGRPKNKS